MKIFRQAIHVMGLAICIITLTATCASADYFFSDNELAEFLSLSNANACREKCTFKLTGSDVSYSMLRLELFRPSESRQVYLVQSTGGGSAGYPSAVLLRDSGRMSRLEERFGLDTDRAERIARRALGLTNSRESVSGTSPAIIALVVLCVAILFVLTAIVTRRIGSGLSIWQRVVLQSITALVSSLGLYAFGVVDKIDLLALPLIAGVTVTLAISVRDFLS